MIDTMVHWMVGLMACSFCALVIIGCVYVATVATMAIVEIMIGNRHD